MVSDVGPYVQTPQARFVKSCPVAPGEEYLDRAQM